MINPYALGFCAIGAVAFIGVDYTNQAQSDGKALGSLSVSDYLGTYVTRYEEQSAEKDKERRQGELAKVHLPEAPEGWQRQFYEPEFSANPTGDYDPVTEDEAKMVDALNNSFVAKAMHADGIRKAKTEAKKEVWEYVRGDEVIRLRVKYTDPNEALGIQGTAMAMVAANMALTTTSYDGYAIIKGVPFFQPTALFSEDEAPVYEEDEIRPINLIADVGDDIKLGIEGMARPSSVRMLAELIDYDGLNLMLNEPMAAVGSNAPTYSPEEEIQVVEAAAALKFKKTRNKSAEMEQRLINMANGLYKKQSLTANVDTSETQSNQLEEVQKASVEQQTTPEPEAEKKEADKRIVSKRLPDSKIEKLAALSGAEKQTAMAGLQYSAKKFEEKNNLPEGSCTFSFETFRVECDPSSATGASDAAEANTGGTSAVNSILGFFKGGDTQDAGDPPPKPTRLKLANEGKSGSGCVGSFCN